MKKFLFLAIWHIFNALNSIFLFGGAIIATGFTYLGAMAIFVFIISFFFKINDHMKFLIIAGICFSVKYIVTFIYAIIQTPLNKLREKIDELE
ncbi:hypothetical protein [Fusobacterium sp.]|uniref:hypothetical protein n=1 Tax=Fusobacterium sp. TaxID=68766 RepID=UPI00261A7860|nr:hypothetical protein [Fusobacterium sp.]